MKKLLPLIILTLMITGCSKPEKQPETVPSDILIQEDDMTDEEKELQMIQSCIDDYNYDKTGEKGEYYQVYIPPLPIGITSLPEISSLKDLEEIKDDDQLTNTAYVGKYNINDQYSAVFKIYHPERIGFWLNGKLEFHINPESVVQDNPDFSTYKQILDELLPGQYDVLNWLYGIDVSLGDEIEPGYYEVLGMGNHTPKSIGDIKEIAESIFTSDFLKSNYYPTAFNSSVPVYKMIDDQLCCVLTELYVLPGTEFNTSYIVAAEDTGDNVRLNILTNVEGSVSSEIYEMNLINTPDGYRLSEEY